MVLIVRMGFLCTIFLLITNVNAERIAITPEQALDYADLIVLGSVSKSKVGMLDLGKKTEIVNGKLALINSLSKKGLRVQVIQANLKVAEVLYGEVKSNPLILQQRRCVDLVHCNNVSFSSTSENKIWYLYKRKRGTYSIVDGDFVLPDTTKNRNRIIEYAASKDSYNFIFSNENGSLKKYFHETGINVNSKNYFGDTALNWAIQRSDLVVIKSLISLGAKINASNNSKIPSALDQALKIGNRDVIQYLLFIGAKANALFFNTSASLSDFEIYLSLGANVNAGLNEGSTPLIFFLSQKRGNIKHIQWLINHGAATDFLDDLPNQPIVEAFRFADSVELGALLLDNGARINSKDDRGWTALIQAVTMSTDDNITQNVRWLLENGADPNYFDRWGQTPLYQISKSSNSSNVELIKLLLKAGANPNLPTKHGEVVLDEYERCKAWKETCKQIYNLLFAHGAEISTKLN